MSVSFFQQTIPAWLQSLPLSKLSDAPLSLSGGEVVQLLPFLALVSFAAFLPFLVLAIVLKTKDPHKGLLQWSPAFYDGSATSALPYVSTLFPNVLAVVGTALGGWWTWLVFFVGYVIVPIADLLVGEDSYNPTPEQEKALKKQILFRVFTWLYVPAQIVTTVYGGWYIHQRGDTLTTLEYAGIIVSVGTAAGFGIGCVHELTHRPTLFEFVLANISLGWTSYGHFAQEHLSGHHRRVATDEDPASSALGESLYAFLPRVFWGSFVSAWDIEKKYQNRKGRSLFNIKNRILPNYIHSALLAYGFYTFFGKPALVYFLLQGLISSITLESVNYIEHHGLRRRALLDKDGKPLMDKDGEPAYERPGWFHAWNTGDRITNYLLFKIERHPDHHTSAGRPYQILRTFKESPTFPTGYAGMIVLSWVPFLFNWVMEPLVEKAYRDRAIMEESGENWFPSGANNMSSYFKREGEGFFEPGSSPYADPDFYGSDVKTKRVVWESDFNELEKKVAGGVLPSAVEKRTREALAAASKKSK